MRMTINEVIKKITRNITINQIKKMIKVINEAIKKIIRTISINRMKKMIKVCLIAK